MALIYSCDNTHQYSSRDVHPVDGSGFILKLSENGAGHLTGFSVLPFRTANVAAADKLACSVDCVKALSQELARRMENEQGAREAAQREADKKF